MRDAALDPWTRRPTRLLVVDLAAVGREDLFGPATPWLHEQLRDGGAAALQWPRGVPDAEVLWRSGLTEAMRERGFDVDRRALLARPRWRSDEAVCRSLARRPRGPAEVTFLQLTAPAAAAAAQGPGSAGFEEALRRSEGNLRHALETLSVRGERPDLALFAWGAYEPVQMVLDLSAIRRRRRLRGVHWTLRPELASIDCPDGRREHELRSVLGASPLSDHGTVLDDEAARALGLPVRPGVVHFAPRTGIALRDVAGRPVLREVRGRHTGLVHLAGLGEVFESLELAQACALLSALRGPAPAPETPTTPEAGSPTIHDVDDVASPLADDARTGVARASPSRSRAGG